MREFDYRKPDQVSAAITQVAEREDGAFLGGGTNLVDNMKLGIARPDLLVDVTGLPFDEVEPLDGGGARIGTNVRNSDLAAHPLIRNGFPVLAEALLAGASGQLRNLATTGGNLLQRTRCVYFRDLSTPCNKRVPGSGCSARNGFHRNHAIFGASEQCVATHPSDMAVAMAALDAQVRIAGPDGERTIAVTEFHRLPGQRPELDTVLDHGELITGIDLPAMPAQTRSTYRKVRERASFAFALVSVAATLELGEGRIRHARIALGGVAHKPWRAHAAEDALRGAEPTAEAFADAAATELSTADPLPGNAYKVPLARNTMIAVLNRLAGGTSDGRGV